MSKIDISNVHHHNGLCFLHVSIDEVPVLALGERREDIKNLVQKGFMFANYFTILRSFGQEGQITDFVKNNENHISDEYGCIAFTFSCFLNLIEGVEAFISVEKGKEGEIDELFSEVHMPCGRKLDNEKLIEFGNKLNDFIASNTSFSYEEFEKQMFLALERVPA